MTSEDSQHLHHEHYDNEAHSHPNHSEIESSSLQSPSNNLTNISPNDPDPLVLTIRSHSGLSGDMFLAGMLCMTEIASEELNGILKGIMPELTGCLTLETRNINHINGWHAHIDLPKQHEHRHLEDILKIIAQSTLSEKTKDLASEAFRLLAKAEAKVHGVKIEEIHFHEVGALDSILDTCLTLELYQRLAPKRLILSPIPIADGSVTCAHGILPVPAPAVLQLLPGLAVSSFAASGETLTPTAAALLQVLPVEFGAWPPMRVEKTALVYGDKIFPNVPNGATFAQGRLLKSKS